MDRKGTFKVEYLQQIERKIQEKWEQEKVYETDAPEEPRNSPTEKFFCTFPFPYMNGRLHLGHTFSLSKCEFAVRYNRLKGKRVLFPFGFHCTGMPIKACADKLKFEMTEFGYPPVFPQTVEVKEEIVDITIKDKSKGKKSKAVSKAGSSKWQWQIMQSLGLSHEEIKLFANPEHWLDYFPPLAVQDLRSIGLHVDWRRTFITTDVNPYFDQFVRWQFLHLKERGKVLYGKRYTVYSVLDGQPCMDHDRSSGEGVGPQEFTLIKMKVIDTPNIFKSFSSKQIFFVAATLRPETMYGQTNCWLHPDINYVLVESKSGALYICSKRSAKNMAYQEMLKQNNVVEVLGEFKGQELLGIGLKAPLTSFDIIYTLPMLTIREDKGTGVVTSVPSDSPDDYAALMDLKNKPAFRAKYNVLDHMVLPYGPVPIITVPDFGNLSAVTVCEKLKIQSQNDKVKLLEAKELVYLKGFYDGILEVGEYKGQKIQDVKKNIQAKIIENGDAVIYYEPEKPIISRSGDECVIALCDQWYLDYGEKCWKAQAHEALANINTYHDEVKKNFTFCLNWLHEYACSRTYGLGTKLPWDEQWLIESLSDSTIYMAFYTVVHLLQGGSFKGETPSPLNILAEQMTSEVWDYIFFSEAPIPQNTTIPLVHLQKLRREFQYWYPVDLRVSGKDLIQNHLTFFIFNHCAMWPNNPELWPQGIRANGHLLLNSAKMSKSEGNFLTLSEAVQKFSADGLRLCLADSGDSIEDANFVEATADAGILRLFTFIEWVKEIKANLNSLRFGSTNSFHDKVFISEMNLKIKETDMYYKKMLYKEALRTGFYELQAARDKYREMTMYEGGMHKDLVLRFIEVQVLIISPICPHVSEHVWNLLDKPSTILDSNWPEAGEVDEVILNASSYLMECAHSFRMFYKNHNIASAKSKSKDNVVNAHKKPNEGIIWIAKSFPPWQHAVLSTLNEMYQKKQELPDNKTISVALGSIDILKKHMKKVMPFVQMVKEKVEKKGSAALNVTSDFDEFNVLNGAHDYLCNTLDLEHIDIKYTDDDLCPEKTKEECCPGAPYMSFNSKPGVMMSIVNPVQGSGYFTCNILIKHGDTVQKVLDRIHRLENIKTKIDLWMFKDPLVGSRKLPSIDNIKQDKEKLSSTDIFDVDCDKNEVYIKKGDTRIFVGSHLSYM
ncbi:leucine--tRNA ligase, cytoplasmic [Ctenocephalides felis]|uniref:leucine--tRNA ligase, cytoplasmic n=1 Tax=Ctenocephalides felis TaxID=7515 RepID=UPI000E6E1C0C|nr:leucine--tRNA ligase, cytoplasmic [Ctenocephalides felis]